MHKRALFAALAATLGCANEVPATASSLSGGEPTSSGDSGVGGTGSDGPGPSSTGTGSESGKSSTEDTGERGSSGTVLYDVGDRPGRPPQACKVGDMDAPGACETQAPPDSFEPELQWSWTSPTSPYSMITPLVANLTDDNDDGAIDLCDKPDIVVVSYETLIDHPAAELHVLDGETGAVHFTSPVGVEPSVTPALGDIDGDGLVEIVTTDLVGHILVLEHDGSLAFLGQDVWPQPWGNALALADLDNDGDVEIIAGNHVFDHHGTLLWAAAQYPGDVSASTAADLDDDGDLEVILGYAAYDHDGFPQWVAPSVGPGFPQVADLDDDGRPEILVTTSGGIALLDHDGTVQYQGLKPTGDPDGIYVWMRPAVIHDLDGDDAPEFAMSSANHYSVFEPDAQVVWSSIISDVTGVATGTAFDFLGDGIAEAMYADEHTLFVFDGQGAPLLENERTSGTMIEYPVVADVDNDGSAEILVVSNPFLNGPSSPTLQVVRDVDDRWIQARRIWNQHTYHVTNVLEDGRIPQFEMPHWEGLNTFRTNAQIEGGIICDPMPEG